MNDPEKVERILRGLSQRQCQVLYWIFQGLEYIEIGQRLGFSEKTIQGDMSKVYRLLGLTGNTVPEKRRILEREIRPIYERLIDDPSGDCSARSNSLDSVPPDPLIVAEVEEDAQKGLIPLPALIVVQQPQPSPASPSSYQYYTRSPSGASIEMMSQNDRSKPIVCLLVGILSALLCVALAVIGYLIWGVPRSQPSEVALTTPQSVPQTVLNTSTTVAVPQTVIVPSTEVAQQTAVVRETVSVPQTVVVEKTVVVPQTVIVTQIATAPVPTADRPTATPIGAEDGEETILFSDSFDNGIDPRWSRAGGDFRMANGRLVNTDRDGIIWLDDTDWTDITVEADLEGGGGCDSSADPMQLLIRVQDTQNYLAVRRGSCGRDGVYIYRDGEPTQLLGLGGREGLWRVEVKGRIFEVYSNGERVGQFSDDSFASGGVGIRFEGGSIDDFTVKTNTQ